MPGPTARTIALVLVVAATGALAACGVAAPPPTRERQAFAIDADRICANLTDAVKPLRDKATRAVEHNELDDAVHFARTAAASGTAFLDQLAQLTPPAGDRAAVATWIAELRAQQSKTTQVADAIAARDPQRATKLNEQISDLARRTQRFAYDFGMQICSK